MLQELGAAVDWAANVVRPILSGVADLPPWALVFVAIGSVLYPYYQASLNHWRKTRALKKKRRRKGKKKPRPSRSRNRGKR